MKSETIYTAIGPEETIVDDKESTKTVVHPSSFARRLKGVAPNPAMRQKRAKTYAIRTRMSYDYFLWTPVEPRLSFSPSLQLAVHCPPNEPRTIPPEVSVYNTFGARLQYLRRLIRRRLLRLRASRGFFSQYLRRPSTILLASHSPAAPSVCSCVSIPNAGG